MSRPPRDYERTIAFADDALKHLRALRLPAVPRNFEIWYVYSTGSNTALNKTIDDTLASAGKLTEVDLDQIYDSYLSPLREHTRIDAVGARIKTELDGVMNLMSQAMANTAHFGESLHDASRSLVRADDSDTFRAMIHRLMESTDDIRAQNSALEARLAASKQEIDALQSNLEAIRAESLTDPLTTLGNRKFFDRALGISIGEARSENQPLSLVMLDIDHFKSFNDKYGHLTGDQVLRLVAMALRHNIKGRDVTARYGGEEFAVILPNTNLRQAIIVANHIRRAVMSKELKKKSTGEILGRVTISAGVSLLSPTDDAETLLERADSCLYAAKHAGRNRVVCETDGIDDPAHIRVA